MKHNDCADDKLFSPVKPLCTTECYKSRRNKRCLRLGLQPVGLSALFGNRLACVNLCRLSYSASGQNRG